MCVYFRLDDLKMQMENLEKKMMSHMSDLLAKQMSHLEKSLKESLSSKTKP